MPRAPTNDAVLNEYRKIAEGVGSAKVSLSGDAYAYSSSPASSVGWLSMG